MPTKRRSQQWVLDALAGTGGWDILHPGIRGIFEELGYYHGDVDRVFEKVKAASMYAKAWATTAQEVEKRPSLQRGWDGRWQHVIFMPEPASFMVVHAIVTIKMIPERWPLIKR